MAALFHTPDASIAVPGTTMNRMLNHWLRKVEADLLSFHKVIFKAYYAIEGKAKVEAKAKVEELKVEKLYGTPTPVFLRWQVEAMYKFHGETFVLPVVTRKES